MEHEIQLLPYQASEYAPQIDALYYFLLGVALFFTGLICVLILYFAIRWRRGSRANRLISIPESRFWIMEVAWTVIPFIIAMTSFAWGAALYYKLFQFPPEGLDVFIVGKQWMWKLQHEEGRREINTLHVPIGMPVRLTMISEDVIHSFYLPAFRTKMDVLPGRYTRQWFVATREGEYHLFCAEYCGTSHAEMIGKVIVMKPEDYADWIVAEAVEPPERTGERLVEQHGCTDCHRLHQPPEEIDEPVRAPSLAGVYGRRERLSDGRAVVVDFEYIRRSIRTPRADVVAGFSPIMPVFTPDQLSEADIYAISAYLQSLSTVDGGEAGPIDTGTRQPDSPDNDEPGQRQQE